jgi:hypothetical protein
MSTAHDGHMRTTIRISDDLLTAAKRTAAASGKTLTALIEDALREVVYRHSKSNKKKSTKLPVHRSGGIRPGVDLNDNSSLLAMMES